MTEPLSVTAAIKAVVSAKTEVLAAHVELAEVTRSLDRAKYRVFVAERSKDSALEALAEAVAFPEPLPKYPVAWEAP